jgi:hypothetical protein
MPNGTYFSSAGHEFLLSKRAVILVLKGLPQ